MRRPLPHAVTLALAGCAGVALLTAAAPPKPVTEWVARPSEAARIARVEAGLAPVTLPGEAPHRLSLQRWMELYKIPGLSVAVFEKNTLVWAKSYGVARAGDSEPVTVDTLFQAASISKPVTALAALHYAEQGKWSLDANINDTLVSWKVPDNEFTQAQKVTLRRLLSHTAGLTVHGFPGYTVDEPKPTLVQILDGVKPANTEPVRVDRVPGTEARYSGGGLVVLQQMMVDQLKKPFPRIMSETVLSPLGLKHSTFEQPLPAALAPMSASGTRASGETVEGRWHVYPEMAPAGLWTTPSDLARIAIEVSKARAGASKRVVSPAMAKQMLTKQSDGFGLGFQLEEGNDRFGHGGWNDGFTSALIAFANSGSGVVLMANSDNAPLLFDRVAASIAAEYGWKDFSHHLDSPMMTADLLARLKGAEAVIAWYTPLQKNGPPPMKSPRLLNQVAFGQMLAGRTQVALKLLEANATFYPEDASVYDSLGEAYMKAGRNQDAITSFKKSLKLDPRNTHATEMLKKLGARP